MSDPSRLSRALAAIDAANADDPNTLPVRGAPRPKELAHAELVSEWVLALAADASEALQLAARAHHVRRWEIRRDDFPEGRAGYHRWRKAEHAHHARILGAILVEVGYDEESIRRATDLVQKRGLGRDPEVQVLEDALCLVFLETQFTELAGRLPTEKLLDVTRKTLRKMSPRALARARELPIDAEAHDLLERALRAEALE